MICPTCEKDAGLGYCWTCKTDLRETKVDTATTLELPADSPSAPREWSVTIPWDCMVSVNKRSGGMAGWTTKEYREKRDAMTTLIRNEYDGDPHTGGVFVAIELYPPNRRGDPHNFCKVIYDALEHAGVVADDKLITRWEGTRFYVDKDNPRAYVRVEKREEAA